MNFHQEPVTFVGQVNLKVQDLERSLAFYQKVIGFKVLTQTDHSAKLTADGETILVSLEQPNDIAPIDERATGLYHLALLLPTRADLANIVRHFRKYGLKFGSSDHLVSEALYLSDPDGNGIEIYIDRVPSEWVWQDGEVAMAVDPLNFVNLLEENKEQSWNGLPSETVMGHIHLRVADLVKTEEFYTKGLGFDVVNRYGAQAIFISDGQYHHHIGLNTWNGVGAPAPSSNRAGLESFTLVLPNEENKNKIVSQLENIGATMTEENGLTMTIDPSGNRIYLQV